MKRLLLTAAMAALLGTYTLAFAAPVQQEQSGDQQMSQAGPGGEHGQWAAQHEQKHLQMMTKKLNLSADQQSKVKSILDDQQKQMMSLRQDSSMSQDDRRAKMMQMHETSSNQIRALLNEDQQKKFDQMESNMKNRMARHHRGEGAPPPDQPQSQDQPQ